MPQRPGFMARSRRIETMTRAIGARSRTLKWLAAVDFIVKLAVLRATAIVFMIRAMAAVAAAEYSFAAVLTGVSVVLIRVIPDVTRTVTRAQPPYPHAGTWREKFINLAALTIATQRRLPTPEEAGVAASAHSLSDVDDAQWRAHHQAYVGVDISREAE